MKITRKWLKKHDACEDAVEVFAKREKELKTDKEVINAAMKLYRFDWAIWLIVRLMNKKQKVQYAVFAAELVLGVFEKRYPEDDRPRKAIEAAKAYLKRPCSKTKKAAYFAYISATFAPFAAFAASAAYAASVAAFVASSSATAADAAADAVAAGAATRKKIIDYGLELLEENKDD